MTLAELSAEVAGQLEIDETDYTRFNLTSNANKAIRHLAATLPAELIPELIRAKKNDFETTGFFEPQADFVRSIRLLLTFSGTTLGERGAEARWLHPAAWATFKTLSDMPTTDYPVYTHLGDLFGVAPSGKNGTIAILPVPAAKVTDGAYHVYVGFKDVLDAAHDIPLGERLRNLVIATTCRITCLVEHFDATRATAYDGLIKEELTTLIPPGK